MYEKKGKNSGKPAPKLTTLTELGEFGLIDRLTKNISIHNPTTFKGIGDDAAVIDPGNKLVLVSTDLLVEGIHFDMTYTPLKHLGYKSVVVNVSDIAAMNGVPGQITISMAISSRFPAEALDEIYDGIKLACEKYQVDLIGGDTSSSTIGLMISVTILGKADKDEIVYRNGAKPGDLLCVTGDLGSAYIGLLLLEREKKVFQANPGMQPELTGFDYQVGRILKPEARTDFRAVLQEINVKPTSMIDISDGLASEALHLCKQSDVGCKIYENKIPIDAHTREVAIDFNIIPTVATLSGGEDYELLFTISQNDYEKVKDVTEISVIGHMTPPGAGKFLVTPEGKESKLTAQGWDGFK